MKTIKEMFNEKINKENIKNNVVGRVNNNYHFKWGLSIACLLVLIGIGGVSTLMLKKQSNNITLSNSNNYNIIRWNHQKLDDNALFEVDWDAREKSIDEFILDYPWIKNLVIPDGYTLDTSHMMYYNSLMNHDYFGNVIMYRTEESLITIYFSSLQKYMPRCLKFYDIEELEDSSINGVSMKLVDNESRRGCNNDFTALCNDYTAFFQKDGLYFDIAIYNGNKSDFIQLLESITE